MDNVVIYHNIDNVAEVLSYADICIELVVLCYMKHFFFRKTYTCCNYCK